jgi:hypothetical protein
LEEHNVTSFFMIWVCEACCVGNNE